MNLDEVGIEAADAPDRIDICFNDLGLGGTDDVQSILEELQNSPRKWTEFCGLVADTIKDKKHPVDGTFLASRKLRDFLAKEWAAVRYER